MRLFRLFLLFLFCFISTGVIRAQVQSPADFEADLGSVPASHPSGFEADFGLAPASHPAQSRAPQNLVFSGDPIPIILSVGQERRIEFQEVVEVGITAEQSRFFKVEIYGKTLLITPKEAIQTRVVVNQVKDNVAFPLDLQITTQPLVLGAVQILTSPAESTQPNQAPVQQSSTKNTIQKTSINGARVSLDYIDLIRFAAQQFYSPARLVQIPRGTQSRDVITQSIRIIQNQNTHTRAVASWKIGAWYVTAINVKNALDRSIDLDPRALIGQLKAATFYQHRLAKRGEVGDETMLFVVTDMPLEAALGINIPGANQKAVAVVDTGRTK